MVYISLFFLKIHTNLIIFFVLAKPVFFVCTDKSSKHWI